MNATITSMEDFFSPGFKTAASLFVGSQTSPFIHGIAEEQAWEGFYLGATGVTDVTVVRDIDPGFISYWNSLMGKREIINLENTNPGEYLTNVILNDPSTQHIIKAKIKPDTKLMVFFPTELEEKLAKQLSIPLHGKAKISSEYGIKSGGRRLAEKAGIPIPAGFICTTIEEMEKAARELFSLYDSVVMKHDLSFSGFFSKKIARANADQVEAFAHEISGGTFTNGKDIIVVEGWLKAKASLCAHIEILDGQDPIICGGWQQLLEDDGISYAGAAPLQLSTNAFNSFFSQVKALANTLKEAGAIGSFGPDFLITADDETRVEPDSAVFIELNARVPYTAVPLEIIKSVRGQVGSGFVAKHVKVKPNTSFKEICEILSQNKLLITSPDKSATGIIPHNIGVLPWGVFDIVAIADSFGESRHLVKTFEHLLNK